MRPRCLTSHLRSVPPQPAERVYVIAWPLSCPWAASCSHGFGGGQTGAHSPAPGTSKSEFSWAILQKRRQRDRGVCAFSREGGQLTGTRLPCSLSLRHHLCKLLFSLGWFGRWEWEEGSGERKAGEGHSVVEATCGSSRRIPSLVNGSCLFTSQATGQVFRKPYKRVGRLLRVSSTPAMFRLM